MLLPCSHFEPCPFSPEVDAARRLDHIRNVRAAHSRSDLNEIKLAVGVRLQEFRVRHTAHEPETRQQITIDLLKRLGFFSIVRKRARGENPAVVRSIQRWRAICMRCREYNAAF